MDSSVTFSWQSRHRGREIEWTNLKKGCEQIKGGAFQETDEKRKKEKSFLEQTSGGAGLEGESTALSTRLRCYPYLS